MPMGEALCLTTPVGGKEVSPDARCLRILYHNGRRNRASSMAEACSEEQIKDFGLEDDTVVHQPPPEAASPDISSQ